VAYKPLPNTSVEINKTVTPMNTPSQIDEKPDRDMLRAKADEIDEQVKRLQAMSKGLRHAAACPEDDHLACPTFQRLMKVAAAGVRVRERRSNN
jgi:hypothetical protein